MINTKVAFIYFLSLFSTMSFSQKFCAKYKTIVLDPESTFVEYSENELVINDGISIYYSTRLDTIFQTTTGDLWSTPSSKKRDMFLFKDLNKKHVHSYRQFSRGLVIDSSYSVAWNISNEKKVH